jgi:hypothetical protein
MQRHVAATDGSELQHQPDLLITVKDETGFIDRLDGCRNFLRKVSLG